MKTSNNQPDQAGEHLVRCPFCGSDDTEHHALFGSLLLMTQHYCRSCRSIFERLRDDAPDEH